MDYRQIPPHRPRYRGHAARGHAVNTVRTPPTRTVCMNVQMYSIYDTITTRVIRDLYVFCILDDMLVIGDATP